MDRADTGHLLLPILERRAYAAGMRDREGAAKLAAIANLPIGWVFEDPRRDGDYRAITESESPARSSCGSCRNAYVPCCSRSHTQIRS